MTINPETSPKLESPKASAFAPTVHSNVQSPETVGSPESVREAFTGALDVGQKPSPESTGEYIQIEMFLVRKLRTFQVDVNRYIRGYLVFVDLQQHCEQARNDVEQSHPALPNLRLKAWDQVRDIFERRPDGLDHVLKDLGAELQELRDLITGDSSPLYRKLDDSDDFYRQVGRKLGRVIDVVATNRGDFQRLAINALEGMSNYVESIFNRSEEARGASRGPFAATGMDLPSDAVKPEAFRRAVEANQGMAR